MSLTPISARLVTDVASKLDSQFHLASWDGFTLPEGPVQLSRRSLLLRHGHVYSGGPAWTLAHDAWLRRTRLDQPGTRAALEANYEHVQLTLARRDRLDAAITAMAADSEVTAVPAGCAACGGSRR